MYVRVKVAPGSKKEIVEKLDELRYQMTVKEPAVNNLANTRVKELLCREYRIGSNQVRLISGHRSPNKIFDVDLKHHN